MKMLAIDTSTPYLCVGLYDTGKTYGFGVLAGRSLSAVITVSIMRVLEAGGWRVSDIECIACGVGPGSFTGVRIGMSAAKALAWSAGKRMIAVRSLDMLALGAEDDGRPIVTVMDAKRDLVYWSLYHRKAGVLRRVKPYALSGIEEVVKAAPRGSVFTGDGIERYGTVIAARAKMPVLLEKDFWYPKPHLLVSCALGVRKTCSAFEIKPEYLYPMDCQVRR